MPISPPDSPPSLPEHWIDEVGLPENLMSGHTGTVVVRGWLVASPAPVHVVVQVDGVEVAHAVPSGLRPDVLEARPDLAERVHGFDLLAQIGPFETGVHGVELVVEEIGLRRELGSIKVLPEHWVEEVLLPPEIRHGERLPCAVRGWLRGAVAPRRFTLRVDGLEAAQTSGRRDRPDVVAARPELAGEVHGFDFAAQLGPFGLGDHRLELVAEELGLFRHLGSFRVVPVHRLEVQRVLAPARVKPDGPVPVAVLGRVLTSRHAPTVEVRVGKALLAARWLPSSSLHVAGSPEAFGFCASGRVEIAAEPGQVEIPIEVWSRDDGGGEQRWAGEVSTRVDPEAGEPLLLETRRLGPFDPRQRTTPVLLRGVYLGARPGDVLELRVDSARRGSAPLVLFDPADREVGAAYFVIDQGVGRLGPGEHEIELVLARGERGAGTPLKSWREVVGSRGESEPTLSLRASALEVGVVVILRARADGALARLHALLAAAGVAAPPVAIVDLDRPERWQEEISERLFVMGGAGHRGWLAALAAGARRLVERHPVQLVVAATEELAGVGDSLVSQLDAYALETALRSHAALGLLEPGVEAGEVVLKGGFVVLPAPVACGLEPKRGESEPLALADRLRGLGVELLDLRTVRRLRECSVRPGSLPSEALTRLAGLAPVPGPDSGAAVPLQYWIDESYVSETARHGELSPVVLRGWVVAAPIPRRIAVLVDGVAVAHAEVAIRRADVLASRPEMEHEVCGFSFSARIGPLDLGYHELEWAAEGTELRRPLGSLRVLPVHRLEIDRVLAPTAVPPASPVPVAFVGRVVTSAADPAVEVRVGGFPVAVRIQRSGVADPSGPAVFEFCAEGSGSPVLEPDAAALPVEIRSEDGGGRRDRWAGMVEVRIDAAAEVPALLLETREVLPFDPRLRSTPVTLRGVVFEARRGDAVELVVDTVRRGSAPLLPLEPAAEGPGAARFALDLELDGLAAGEHDFELVLHRGRGARGTLARWRQVVVRRAVEIRDVEPSFSGPAAGAGWQRVVVEGRLAGAELVESLALAVDGLVRTRLGAEWLRPAPSEEGPGADWHQFRFDAEMVIAPGRRRFEIRARRGAEEHACWAGEVVVPAGAVLAPARIRSADLDRLLRADPSPVWSQLALAGELVGGPPGTLAVLRLDGRRAAEAPVAEDGGFRVAARPRTEGVVTGRLEFEAESVEVARSPAFRIAVRPLEIPRDTAASLARVAARIRPGGLEALGVAPADVVRRLFERHPGAIGPLRRALAALERRGEEAARRPAQVVETPPTPPERRLSVLFASWEAPYSGHGGGVCGVNLLRHLGARHDLTLVHTLAPGEEGLSEEVRPHVREILTVRREWRERPEAAEFGVPDHIARSFSPRVREVLEAEVASGRYDLVDYEYTEMALHAAAASLPAVGALYELLSFAEIRSAPSEFASAEEASDWLARVLPLLHFETAVIAERLQEIVTLTRPEAEFLAGWLPRRRLLINPIPIDVERIAAATPPLAEVPGPPLFVFAGSFVHPPNRESARLLVERIAPAVLRRRPDCRFVICGAHPPEEVRALARRVGVEVPGFVPDLPGLVGRATAFLAPIVSGGGMRVKLLEAMAAGCAVVSTALGLNGIAAVPGQDALPAESVEEFVEMAVRLADDPALARRVGAAGRALVARDHGIAAQGERRERIWRSVLDAVHR